MHFFSNEIGIDLYISKKEAIKLIEKAINLEKIND